MTHYTLHTTVIYHDSRGGEVEHDVKVTYTYYPSFAGDRTDPPEPASIEIQSVTPDVPESCYDALAEECFEDYAAMIEDAAERRWEDRRDERWDG